MCTITESLPVPRKWASFMPTPHNAAHAALSFLFCGTEKIHSSHQGSAFLFLLTSLAPRTKVTGTRCNPGQAPVVWSRGSKGHMSLCLQLPQKALLGGEEHAKPGWLQSSPPATSRAPPPQKASLLTSLLSRALSTWESACPGLCWLGPEVSQLIMLHLWCL